MGSIQDSECQNVAARVHTRRVLARVLVMLSLASGCDGDSNTPSLIEHADRTSATVPVSHETVQSQRPAASAVSRSALASMPQTPIAADVEPVSSEPCVSVSAWRPLLDARAGEWSAYQTLDRKTIRYDITRIAPSAVVTRVTVRDGGRVLGEPALREETPDWEPLEAQAKGHDMERRCAADTIEVAGRRWPTTCYEDHWLDEGIHYVRRTWVSSEVPFAGIVRMELRGDDRLEAQLVLVDCSSAMPIERQGRSSMNGK